MMGMVHFANLKDRTNNFQAIYGARTEILQILNKICFSSRPGAFLLMCDVTVSQYKSVELQPFMTASEYDTQLRESKSKIKDVSEGIQFRQWA